MGTLQLFRLDGESWSNEHSVEVVCARCATVLECSAQSGTRCLNEHRPMRRVKLKNNEHLVCKIGEDQSISIG
jgi:hypothetical protein